MRLALVYPVAANTSRPIVDTCCVLQSLRDRCKVNATLVWAMLLERDKRELGTRIGAHWKVGGFWAERSRWRPQNIGTSLPRQAHAPAAQPVKKLIVQSSVPPSLCVPKKCNFHCGLGQTLSRFYFAATLLSVLEIFCALDNLWRQAASNSIKTLSSFSILICNWGNIMYGFELTCRDSLIIFESISSLQLQIR